jgi:hypothetical protein
MAEASENTPLLGACGAARQVFFFVFTLLRLRPFRENKGVVAKTPDLAPSRYRHVVEFHRLAFFREFGFCKKYNECLHILRVYMIIFLHAGANPAIASCKNFDVFDNFDIFFKNILHI